MLSVLGVFVRFRVISWIVLSSKSSKYDPRNHTKNLTKEHAKIYGAPTRGFGFELLSVG